jgi:UDP-glucose 4-epimerase
MSASEKSTILVTGAAGFIGSHLIQKLLQMDFTVRGIDSFVNGNTMNIDRVRNHPNFKFVEGDLLDENCTHEALRETDTVFHLAVTRPAYDRGLSEAIEGYKNDVLATFNLLKSMSQPDSRVKKIVYASSVLIYGDQATIPTPENYGPLCPASPYGASKLASEAFISTFCHTFDLSAAICRLSNIEGSRKPYGVVYDFVNRLREDRTKLEMKGDPTNKRSYLHVSDCVEALLFCMKHLNTKVEPWNIGPGDSISTERLAKIVINEMGLGDVPIIVKDATHEERIKGRLNESRPSIEKIKSHGWSPRHGSEQAVRLAASERISELSGSAE